jgi:potassium-transporting ATPase KdpC subunit
MIKELGPGLRLMIALTILTGLIYPAAMTGIAEALFPGKANGSLVTLNGKIVGSGLIGQSFSKAEYFHPRPSSAGNGYDATASGGSNLGPTSAKLLYGAIKTDDKGKEVVDFDGIEDRIVHYCVENDIPYSSSVSLNRFEDALGNLDDVKLIKAFNDTKAPLIFTPKLKIPADAVTGSASGLDPDISPANADLQAQRVAKARDISVNQVRGLIARATEGPALGFIGEARVNVLLLNRALDQKFPAREQRIARGAE